jgi:GntR family transcriptional regulator
MFGGQEQTSAIAGTIPPDPTRSPEMSTAPSPIPLYHQVFTVLRQRVLDGTYAPGARLAPEDELAAEFDVSRATIRQAVGELVRAGVLSRQQGRGTFVLEGAQASLGRTFRGNLADLVAAGETRRTKLSTLEVEHEARLPPVGVEQLELDASEGTIVRRVRTMDDETFGYMVDHLPPAIGALVSKRELRTSGLLHLLEEKGVRIDRAVQTIRAQVADLTVAERLAIPLGSAVMAVERLLSDADGSPVDFVQSWYRGDRYDYTVAFDRGEGELNQRLA